MAPVNKQLVGQSAFYSLSVKISFFTVKNATRVHEIGRFVFFLFFWFGQLLASVWSLLTIVEIFSPQINALIPVDVANPSLRLTDRAKCLIKMFSYPSAEYTKSYHQTVFYFDPPIFFLTYCDWCTHHVCLFVKVKHFHLQCCFLQALNNVNSKKVCRGWSAIFFGARKWFLLNDWSGIRDLRVIMQWGGVKRLGQRLLSRFLPFEWPLPWLGFFCVVHLFLTLSQNACAFPLFQTFIAILFWEKIDDGYMHHFLFYKILFYFYYFISF